jgi:hypothetical protein
MGGDAVIRVLIDTREQKPVVFPEEVVSGGKRYKIELLEATLPTGDYSVEGHGGRPGECFGIAIERKATWDEIANNVTKDRARIHREFMRLAIYRQALFLIEQPRDWVLDGRLRSRIDPQALLANVDSLSMRYRVPVHYCQYSGEAADVIIATLRRYLNNELPGSRRPPPDDPRFSVAQITSALWSQTLQRLGIVETICHRLLGHDPDAAQHSDLAIEQPTVKGNAVAPSADHGPESTTGAGQVEAGGLPW